MNEIGFNGDITLNICIYSKREDSCLPELHGDVQEAQARALLMFSSTLRQAQMIARTRNTISDCTLTKKQRKRAQDAHLASAAVDGLDVSQEDLLVPGLLHLGQTDVQHRLFLGRQPVLHVRLLTPQQERPQHLR